MPEIFSTLIPFFGVLLVLVTIHELGHFITAKIAGVRVLEFGFGYPPKLFGRRFGETEYTVNLLPLGGFVKLAGEEDPNVERSFASKPVLTRLIILAAGPGMNALLPIVLITSSLLFPRQVLVETVRVGAVAPGSPAAEAGLQTDDIIKAANGSALMNRSDLNYQTELSLGSKMDLSIERAGQTRVVPVYPRWTSPNGEGPTGISLDALVRVAAVQANSPAEAAGIQPGDVVVSVNGKTIRFLQEVSASIRPGEQASIVLERNGARVPISVTPRVNPPAGEGPLGVQLGASSPDQKISTVTTPFFDALGEGTRRSFDMITLFKNGIISSFTAQSGPALTGPIGIAQATGEIAKAGPAPLLEWAALLSMNLAILNILPIPMLDGGRVFFVLLEWVRRGKRISPEREGLVHLVGFVILMGLILLISFNDVARLLKGESIFP